MSEFLPRLATIEVTGISVPLPRNWYFHDDGSIGFNPLLPQFSLPTAKRKKLVRTIKTLVASNDDGSEKITLAGKRLEIQVQHLTRYFVEVCQQDSDSAEKTALNSALFMYLTSSKKVDSSNWQGEFLVFNQFDFSRGRETHLHIFYYGSDRKDLDLFVRAHEEYHALSHIPGAVTLLEEKILKERGTTPQFRKIRNDEVAANCNGVHTLISQNYDPLELFNFLAQKFPNLDHTLAQAYYVYQTGDTSYAGFKKNCHLTKI